MKYVIFSILWLRPLLVFEIFPLLTAFKSFQFNDQKYLPSSSKNTHYSVNECCGPYCSLLMIGV